MQDSCYGSLRLADLFKDQLKSQNRLYGLKSVHRHRYLHKENTMHSCRNCLNHKRSDTFSVNTPQVSLSAKVFEMEKQPGTPTKTENNPCFLLSSFI